MPAEYHRYLIDAAELREEGDYDSAAIIGAEDSDAQLRTAADFIALAERTLAATGPADRPG